MDTSFRKTRNVLLFMLAMSFLRTTYAQSTSSNTVIVSDAHFYFPKEWQPQFIMPFLALYYGDESSVGLEHKVGSNVSIGFTYTTWITNSYLLQGFYPAGGPEISGGPDYFKSGGLEERRKYKMIDLYLSYRYNRWQRNKLSAGLGLSYSQGINTYTDSVFYASGTNVPFGVTSHSQKAHYFGVISSISYDYMLFHNRVNIGADLKGRKYFKLYSSELDYCLHVGLNF